MQNNAIFGLQQNKNYQKNFNHMNDKKVMHENMDN